MFDVVINELLRLKASSNKLCIYVIYINLSVNRIQNSVFLPVMCSTDGNCVLSTSPTPSDRVLLVGKLHIAAKKG